jgi:hypothetical protein
LRFDELGFEILQVLVVDGEPAFEGSLGHAPLALEQFEDVREDLVKRHPWFSTGQPPRAHGPTAPGVVPTDPPIYPAAPTRGSTSWS